MTLYIPALGGEYTSKHYPSVDDLESNKTRYNGV